VNPLFFNSLEFIFLFLPVVLLTYFFTNNKSKYGQVLLTFASLFFYFLLIPRYLPLLLVSIAFNYTIGYLIIRIRNSEPSREKTRALQFVLFTGLLGDLGLLGYYKYSNFLISNLDQYFGFTLPSLDIILPLGISFFTFTQIAFLVDAYQGKVQSTSLLTYTQFVTFFPHLISGPIYHHADIIPQFDDPAKKRPDWTNINLGILFFFFGLAKKVLIADTLATIATPFFFGVFNGGTPMLFESWIGVLAYTCQIYFDFSGYCDMAVGIALLFNIRFPVNFFSPYQVTSVIDFWRCWNITLSNFLRDYLYIPLGGNRHGLPAELRNLVITMILGGLWHGAAWTFIIWGGWHGGFLVCNHLWRKTGIAINRCFCWLTTFVIVAVGWVFFRALTIHNAFSIIRGMAGGNGISVPAWLFPESTLFFHNGFMPVTYIDPVYCLACVGGALGIALLFPNLIDITRNYQTALVREKLFGITRIKPLNLPVSYQISLRWSIIIGIIAAVSIISVQTTSEFLYFQF
jgi:D-alanyl-lipoteichoic acid acyltransferase DltB (MBOAT superfamily)